MKKVYVSSLGLPKGFPILEYENLDEMRKDGGDQVVDYAGIKTDRITAIANSYMHQKDGLVDGRAHLCAWLEQVAKFPWPVKPGSKAIVKKVDGKDVTTFDYMTEANYIDAFIVSAISDKGIALGVVEDGKIVSKNVKATAPGLTIAPADGDDEAKEASVWGFFQALVDKPLKVNVSLNGKAASETELFNLRNTVTAPIRVAKAKAPPQYAVDAATNILTKKSEAKWTKTFTNEGIAFEDFQVAGDVAGNTTRLAWAIQAREQAKARKEYE